MRTFSARRDSLIGEAVANLFRLSYKWEKPDLSVEDDSVAREGACREVRMDRTFPGRNKLFFSSLRWPGPYPELSSAFMQSPPLIARLLGLDRLSDDPGRGNQSASRLLTQEGAYKLLKPEKRLAFGETLLVELWHCVA